MQCIDCGGMTHPGSPCIEYELDVWFWQTAEDGRYGEWIFDNHCTLQEFIEANELEPCELAAIHRFCERETEFTIGGGAAPLFRSKPMRPTTH